MKNLFTLIFFLGLGLFISSCGSEDTCGVTCPAHQVLTADCNCVLTNPCENVTCPVGQVTDSNCNCIESFETIEVSGNIESNTTWTSENIYLLTSKVVVNEGATLTIEPGTIIKGKQGTEALATTLIVARGGKLQACGTEDKPIIFTSELDNIVPGQKTGTTLSQTDLGKWGGVIVLGYAPVSTGDGDIEGQIEGIPADETYGTYGGNNPNDNSGSLCYVSIRHGGAKIAEGNEINGLTLGGVGNGTTINHVEIVGNLDDGVEFFGGTVNVDNLMITYQDDDGIDIDQNYSGTITNFYVIHGGDGTDEGLEIDGPEGSTYVDGFFTLKNGTIVSKGGKASPADFKSKAQGMVENVSWVNYSGPVKFRASFDPTTCNDKSDAYSYAVSGRLSIHDCNYVGTISQAEMASAYSDTGEGEEACFETRATELQTIIDDIFATNNCKVVSSISFGADLSQFRNWTWTDIKGMVE